MAQVARSRVANFCFLLATYYVIAAAAFNGFYDKWGFLDNEPGLAFTDILDGTAVPLCL